MSPQLATQALISVSVIVYPTEHPPSHLLLTKFEYLVLQDE